MQHDRIAAAIPRGSMPSLIRLADKMIFKIGYLDIKLTAFLLLTYAAKHTRRHQS
jgi:hypothetical protein